MRKIQLLLCIVFICIFVSGCSLNQIDANIKNVQETDISFYVDKDTFSDETIKDLKKNDFEVTNESNQVKVSFTVSNIRLSDNIEDRFATILKILKDKDYKVYNSIKDYSFSIESAFNGYPFGAVESVNLKSSNIDGDFKINIYGQDVVSLDNGELGSSIELDLTNLRNGAFISYNMSSIDSLKISIQPSENYKSIEAFYEIRSNEGVLDSMRKEDFEARGFVVESQTKTNLLVSKSFENSEMFNYVFNMDVINFFGVVGVANIDFNVNLVKEVEVDLSFAQSDLIENVEIELILPKEGVDTNSKTKNTTFSWNLNNQLDTTVKSTVPNYSTIIIAIVSTVGITFVSIGLMIIRKRSAHIK